MTVPTKSSSLIPMLYLQPVTDSRDAWVALSLHFVDHTSQLSADSLSALFNECGLAEALGRLSCIVPVTDVQTFSMSVQYAMRPGQIILSVPPSEAMNPANDDSFANLKKAGFGLMLSSVPTQYGYINEHVSMLSVTYEACTDANALKWMVRLSGHHMIEELPSVGQFELAKQVGLKWFAGYTPHKYKVEPTKQEMIARSRVLRLLELVTQDANVSELETLLKQDAALSYQLFRLLGSAAFSFRVEITSFSQAINLLGRRQLQRWLQLLLYARSTGSDGVPNALLPRAAARAALMEALCRERAGARDDQDKAFLIGMFSLLDELLGMPLETVLKPLQLGDNVAQALLAKTGPFGALLRIAEHAEYINGGALSEADLHAAGVTKEMYAHSLVVAYRWASRVSNED
jgi:EAL and modified HD-GYP domain-containing signal transduction protein